MPFVFFPSTNPGHPIRVVQHDGDGKVHGYEYDEPNQLSKTTRPSGATLTYGYDTAGRLTSQTASPGDTKSFTWTPLDAPSTMTDATGTTTWTYDTTGGGSAIDKTLRLPRPDRNDSRSDTD